MPDDASSEQTAQDTATSTPDAAATSAPDTSTSAPADGQGNEQQSTPTSESATQTDPGTASASPAETGNAQQQTGRPATQVEPDWKQRYSHLQSETDRRLNQSKLEMQRVQQETAELRSFRQQQVELAAQKNLRVWQKQHPENQKFAGLRERAKTIDAQMRALPTAYPDGSPIPPEHQAQMRQAIAGAINPQELEQLKQYREETAQFQQAFFEDPRATIAPHIREVLREEMQQMQRVQQAEQRVHQDFNSPELKEMIAAHAPEIKEALEKGLPYEYAIHMTQMWDELQRLRAKAPEVQRREAMATEQQRLAQGRAGFTRDPAPAKNVDVYALAKAEAAKTGIIPGSAQFNQLYDRLEKANKPR